MIPGDGTSWASQHFGGQTACIFVPSGIGPEISEAVKSIYAAAQVRTPFSIFRCEVEWV